MNLDNPTTDEKIFFTLDGKRVEASKGETIWQVAKRYGVTIPHLCWKDAPGYRADGNCRACLLYTSPSPRDKRQSRMPSSA